jgi:hypothetical protein
MLSIRTKPVQGQLKVVLFVRVLMFVQDTPQNCIFRSTTLAIIFFRIFITPKRIQCLAPICNLTLRSPYNVHLEPHNLIPSSMSDTPLLTSPQLYDYIASIAITTVPANNMIMPHDPSGSEKATNHSHRVHHNGTHCKFCNILVLSYLNSSRILLYPFIFIFDPFTASPCGYFVHPFSFFSTSTKQVPPAPKPPWTNHFFGSQPNCTPHLDASNTTSKLACSSSAP